ncbi:ParB-like protein [Synechococcus sp. RS9902]|uniref:ParB-like protein n=1 Tax=Synechococcus sp. RS9902 TaxID=221345 RepID=UPI001647C7F6|nr:ParB-like protein [Synechococcus sp. RS9902]QNI97950.1 parB-like nuclease family protein [Synechococcus sp. RS9902]
MPLRLPAYQPIPAPDRGTDLIEVSAAKLQPTQWCVGLAEIWSREKDFAQDTRQQRLDYLRGKPVPLIRSADGAMWMLDRHHRLRGLIGIDPVATTWGYVVEELPTADRNAVLAHLHNQGWLYLYDGRGNGPLPAEQLPTSLLGLDDDPYRSLVWKLKQEGWIKPQPLIPYHEFRWGAWLRSRPLPPFSSRRLEPALAAARQLVCSAAAQDMPGWKGDKKACR